MSFSVSYLPAVLLTILSLPISLWAQTTPKQTSKIARGSISGKVTIKEKGAAGVVVSLRRTEFTTPFEQLPRATTEQDGSYRIVNVAAGSYEVLPTATAFVPADGKDLRSKPVLLGEDENIENINFALVRGGVITGKVTDADGRPVIQQQVSIYKSDVFDQPSSPSQPRQIFATSGAQTDDRGIYRVFGLLPGRYKVGAGRSEDLFTPPSSPGRSIYKQVFHPDVNEPGKATVIEVGEGTEATNVDIALGRALQTFTISGRVIDGERGLPVPGIRLGVQRNMNQRFEYVSMSATSNSQGDFVMEGLIAGKYSIYMFPNQNSGMRVDAVTFDIIDEDVSGITVKLAKGASLSGAVVLESEDKSLLAKFSQLELRAYVSNSTTGTGGGMGSSAQSPIAPDGGFQLTGLPGGTASLTLGSTNMPFPPKGFMISRIERDGVVAQRGIEIKEGEQLTGLRVVVAYGNAALRGVVKVENGTLPDGARIYVRLTKAGETFSNFRPTQADARGHFLFEGIPSGMYVVHAFVATATAMPPRSAKREVDIQDGAANEVTITIDMSPPKP